MAKGTCGGTFVVGRYCTYYLQEQKAFGGSNNWELALNKLKSVQIGRGQE